MKTMVKVASYASHYMDAKSLLRVLLYCLNLKSLRPDWQCDVKLLPTDFSVASN